MGTAKANESFGSYMKNLRLKAGFGLRRFANLVEIKASNLCDIEHDRRAMPKEHLEPVAEALGLQKDTPTWDRFFRLACQDNELPADVVKIAQRPLMPALLRTVDNVQLSRDEIRELINDLQGRKSAKGESC